jgi:hypothetical protein
MSDLTSLRGLIEMASEHAEATFDPQKTMMMRHLCLAPDGPLSVYVCPVGTVREEIMFRELLPLTFAAQFVRWVFVSEAWMADGMKRGDPLPAAHPRRVEIIVFAATERTGETLAARRQIYRPAVGGARLLPLVYEQQREPHFMMDPSR